MFAFRSCSLIVAFVSALALFPLAVTGFAVLAPTMTGTARTTPSLMIRAAVPMEEDDALLPRIDDEVVAKQEEEQGDIFFAMDEITEKQDDKGTTTTIKLDDVKATLDEVKTKVQTFAQDERVKEISAKAAEFAKDVMGQLFKPVGEKLKELKKEKEEANHH